MNVTFKTAIKTCGWGSACAQLYCSGSEPSTSLARPPVEKRILCFACSSVFVSSSACIFVVHALSPAYRLRVNLLLQRCCSLCLSPWLLKNEFGFSLRLWAITQSLPTPAPAPPLPQLEQTPTSVLLRTPTTCRKRAAGTFSRAYARAKLNVAKATSKAFSSSSLRLKCTLARPARARSDVERQMLSASQLELLFITSGPMTKLCAGARGNLWQHHRDDHVYLTLRRF